MRNFTKDQIEKIHNKLDAVDVEELYLDMLNECSPTVVIGGCSYGHGDVLKKVDPIAFREGYLDYADSLDVIELNTGNSYGYYYLDDIENLFD